MMDKDLFSIEILSFYQPVPRKDVYIRLYKFNSNCDTAKNTFRGSLGVDAANETWLRKKNVNSFISIHISTIFNMLSLPQITYPPSGKNMFKYYEVYIARAEAIQ